MLGFQELEQAAVIVCGLLESSECSRQPVLLKGEIILAHSLGMQSITVGKPPWQRLESAGRKVSTVRKLRDGVGCSAQSSHLLINSVHVMLLLYTSRVGLPTPVNPISKLHWSAGDIQGWCKCVTKMHLDAWMKLSRSK